MSRLVKETKSYNIYTYKDREDIYIYKNSAGDWFIFDAEDLDKVTSLAGVWRIRPRENGFVCTPRINGKKAFFNLNHFILDVEKTRNSKILFKKNENKDYRKCNLVYQVRNVYEDIPGTEYIKLIINGVETLLDKEFAENFAKNAIWYINNCGYVVRNDTLNNDRHVRIHREVCIYYGLEMPEGYVVDHIDRDKLDNRLEKLRVCTYRDNKHNTKRLITNTSGKTGVSKSTYRGNEYWVASAYIEEYTATSKAFSVNKFGEEKAYAMAVAWREEWEVKLGILTD